MTVQVAAFPWVPPFAQGYVRDLRVRWALEEAGLAYETVLIGPQVQASDAYRDWQPFGQVPAYRDGEVEMFESGAIVLRIAGKSEALSPRDEAGAARVTTWVVAALNSIEPHIQNLAQIDVFHQGEAWTVERRPQVEAFLKRRLGRLAEWLGDKDWLEGRFTAGDLIMVTVLREVPDDLLAEFPTLAAYRARGIARPAFGRALEAQLATFRDNAPA
jgi:glutathione S-transferase